MKSKKSKAGFTLVELIVVIAILGILAGVGTVAYSGYITAANKSVDRETVGNLIYAATLADYANPGLLDGNIGMIVLTNDGEAQVVGSNNTAAFASALDDSIGETSALRLSYSKWGTDIGAVNNMLGNISGTTSGWTGDHLGNYLGTDDNGNTVSVGYAPVANDLWDVVHELAFQVVGGEGYAKDKHGYIEDPEADHYAAMFTVFTAWGTANHSTPEQMANAWASTNTAAIESAVTSYTAGDDKTKAATVNIAAKSGPKMALNMAFADYLERNGSYEGVEKDIAQLRDPSIASGSNLVANTSGWQPSGHQTECEEIAKKYLTEPIKNGKSQAYIDGLAYYTFMKSISDTYATDDKITMGENGSEVELPDNFWEEADGYISWAAAVGSGSIDISDMQNAIDGKSGSAVIIVADKTGGTLSFSVSPSDADPRDGSGGESGTEEEAPPTTATESATITITADGATISANPIALKCGGQLNLGIIGTNKISIPQGYTVAGISATVGGISGSSNDSSYTDITTTDGFRVRVKHGTSAGVILSTKTASSGGVEAVANTKTNVTVTFTLTKAGESDIVQSINFTLWAIK